MTAVRTEPTGRPAFPAGVVCKRAREYMEELRLPGSVGAVFDPSAIADLPDPARRWLTHAIPAGTPLWSAADVAMHGRIALGDSWHEYSAQQVLAPDVGFVWAARARVSGLSVVGFDRLGAGEGEMRWTMLGFPVMVAGGSDVTRSAADRLAAEAVLLPTSLLGASWERGASWDTAVYRRAVAGRYRRRHVAIRVAADGRLRSVSLRRWGNPDGGRFAEHAFTVHFDRERVFDGIAVPDGMHAAWADAAGNERPFYRAELETVTFREGAPS